MRILPLKWRRRRLWRIVCGVQVASLWLGLRVFAATPEPAAAAPAKKQIRENAAEADAFAL